MIFQKYSISGATSLKALRKESLVWLKFYTRKTPCFFGKHDRMNGMDKWSMGEMSCILAKP